MSMTREEAIGLLGDYFKKDIVAQAESEKVPTVTEFAHSKFYIPETGDRIKLLRHQSLFLEMALDPANDYTTIVYSTIKKSGKTAVAGVAGRYLAEYSGPKAEIYFIANDKEQAKDRAYEAAKASLELTPGYDKRRRELPGYWKIIEKEATHEPTGSVMRAIASDYEGAAGGNPTATFWTELWAFTLEKFKRLWDELTPVPTRKRSIRFVETYAGFEDESELLLNLYKLGKQGTRLTHDHIDWPFPDQPPIWVNKSARMIMYWDSGVLARRMPWQMGERGEAYYREQATTLREEAFKRFHLNEWVSSKQEFIRIEWWKACKAAIPLPEATQQTPIVMAVDASVSGDCTAIVGVSRHPDPEKADEHTVVRFSQVWFPPRDGTIDYADVRATIKMYCEKYNITQIAYDNYQLHDMMQNITREGIAWCRVFSQAAPREFADKRLYDMVRDRKITHQDEIDEQFVLNCAAYVGSKLASGDKSGRKVETMRIVKRNNGSPVDPVVALSMANEECLRLILE